MNDTFAKVLAIDIIKSVWANDIARPPKRRWLKKWGQITEKKCGEVTTDEIEEIIRVLEKTIDDKDVAQ